MTRYVYPIALDDQTRKALDFLARSEQRSRRAIICRLIREAAEARLRKQPTPRRRGSERQPVDDLLPADAYPAPPAE